AGERYVERIKSDVIDNLSIGWVYVRGGYFAYLNKRMKKESEAAGKFSVADSIAEAGWPIIKNDILDWIKKTGKVVSIVAVPSRKGTSERLALRLSQLLNESLPTPISVIKNLLRRTSGDVELKEQDWDNRAKTAESLFITGTDLSRTPEAVLLVDDVVT